MEGEIEDFKKIDIKNYNCKTEEQIIINEEKKINAINIIDN